MRRLAVLAVPVLLAAAATAVAVVPATPAQVPCSSTNYGQVLIYALSVTHS